jgi:hypothetical protein
MTSTNHIIILAYVRLDSMQICRYRRTRREKAGIAGTWSRLTKYLHDKLKTIPDLVKKIRLKILMLYQKTSIGFCFRVKQKV